MKLEAERMYKRFESIFCPYLKEYVAFNSRGLEHIKFKGRGHARSHQDQYIRLRSISLAPKILSLSHTLQGYFESHELVLTKTKNRREKIAKKVIYYEFVSVVQNVRIRIIVRAPEGEQKYFWSIIPFWKTDKVTGRRLLHNGKPNED